MAIITLGLLDKKLLLILLISIETTTNIIICNETDGYYDGIICTINEEIGSIIIAIILIIIFKPKKEKQREDKNNIKYLLILFMLRAVKLLYEKLHRYIISDPYYRYTAILNTINGFEIFGMSLATFILLKYKYYIHHMISMVVFCLLGCLNDFVLGNFTIIGYKYLYAYIIYIINDLLIFCYLKYMMDKLYYHYTELLLIWGIIGLVIKVFIYSGIIIYEYENNIEGVVNDLKTYFSETNIFTIIFLQFVYFIIDGGIYYLLTLLELYYLRPNHMLISDEINVYQKIFFYEERRNKMYSLIIFLLQMLAMLFYYEIFELNFWGLNKNTAKSIKIRERTENVMRESNVSEIELGEQYYVKHDQTRTSDEDLNVTNDGISNQTSTQKFNLSNEEIALLEENNSNKD